MQDVAREQPNRATAMPLAGWGRHPVLECRLAPARAEADVHRHLDAADSLIPRGAGRAYGDAALNEELTLSMLGMDRFLEFDEKTGALACEAGVLLADVIATFVPRGWFPPVVPGTRFVTVGGMIAADVHGKNHHGDGSFGRHVESLAIVTGDGEVRRCSPTQDAELFFATQGGMGLTGVILSATFRLQRIETAFLNTETIATDSLAEAMALFADEQSGTAWPYSVAWVDCLAPGAGRGRCVLSRGRFAPAEALPPQQRRAPRRARLGDPRRPPWQALSLLLRPATMRMFNRLHYALSARRGGRPHASIAHFEPFFFPLDRLADWHLAYGRRGFVQHQCVLPEAASEAGIAALMQAMEQAGLGAYLAVLKRFGPGNPGGPGCPGCTAPLSFPTRGYTLALDLPMRAETPALLDALDAVVRDHGGRLSLAKDARSKPSTLRRGYAELDAFRAVRSRVGSAGKFASALSRRLEL